MHRDLADRTAAEGIETPVFHDFAQKSDTKIRLRRLQDPQPQGFSKKPAGYMVFLVSLADDIKGQTIANWLKVAAPKEIAAVDIEALVLRARQLEGLQDGAFTPGSMLGKLSQSAKNEIVQALRGLHTTMALTSQHAEHDQASEVEDRTTRVAQTDFGAIQRSVSAVCSAVETPVLQDLDETDQQLAEQDPLIATTGTRGALSLRKAVLSPTGGSEEATEIPSEKLRYDRNSDDVSTRKLATLGQDRVLIEIFYYDESPQDEQLPGPHTQVQRMAKLLCQAEPLNFHVLPCQGFFHNEVRREIGLVFKIPFEMEDKVQPTTLLQLYARYPVMPLGHRIHLAQSLVNAIDHFHRVGWVHKSIRSNNIVFIPSSIPLEDGVVEEASHHESGNSSARWK
ncbi:hypothetical protein INS49_003125 [Diaporthe citri]|uniref:uncharacterized protein n=1 Tax=Diaporthe citri TaxID=83186 RepID=UPI001C8101CB|nr:uncharacterized protein INS49_003125 [Diaporthe citri]KAG6368907.1 hypothetical protein INS49_003125 [Diaporthe citri]